MTAMGIEPRQAVREVLEGTDEPLSTDQIAETLQSSLQPDEVQEALEHWHREIAAVEDVSGKWLWLGLQ
jgi:predicted Zn-ribbon and HTH transcriptional regulator